MRWIILLGCYLGIGGMAIAQQNKNSFSNKTIFREGIYSSLLDFQRNSPSLPFKALGEAWAYEMDGDSNQVYLSKPTMEALIASELGSLDNLWGVSVNGIPYIKVKVEENKQHKTLFVRLYVVGNISYFYYKIFKPKKIQMNVYHPYTGILMGTREVTNRERKMEEWMLRTETGNIAAFDVEHFKEWIADDNKLLKSYEEMSENEAKSKLFKTLLIYNDRNPIYWK